MDFVNCIGWTLVYKKYVYVSLQKFNFASTTTQTERLSFLSTHNLKFLYIWYCWWGFKTLWNCTIKEISSEALLKSWIPVFCTFYFGVRKVSIKRVRFFCYCWKHLRVFLFQRQKNAVRCFWKINHFINVIVILFLFFFLFKVFHFCYCEDSFLFYFQAIILAYFLCFNYYKKTNFLFSALVVGRISDLKKQNKKKLNTRIRTCFLLVITSFFKWSW